MLVLLSAGQCQGDAERLLVGQGDYALTGKGIEEITEAAQTLSHQDFDRAFCSPQQQARESLKIILQHNADPFTITYVDQLRDRSGGIFESWPLREIRDALPPKAYRLWDRDFHEAPPQGESLSDVSDRILRWYRSIHDDSQRTLILSHDSVIQVLVGFVQQFDEPDIIGFKIERAIPYFFNKNLESI